MTEIAAETPELDVIWPVHPNPNVSSVVRELDGIIPNIHPSEPLLYSDLIYLIKHAHLALTDSGGIQEEAPAFDKPVIVLHNTTERPEGVAAGFRVVAGTDTAEILRHFHRIYGDPDIYRRMSLSRNPYEDGTASRQIADISASTE